MTALSGVMQQRRDTAANWTSNNPTLAAGEIGWESNTNLFKIGDGSTAWTSLAYARLNVATGTFTPTLTGAAIGTGGTPLNTADYTFVGGPKVGDHGEMIVDGIIQFGTSGQTFPATTTTVTLPSGFEFSSAIAGIVPPVGAAQYVDSSSGNNAFYGVVTYASTTTVRFLTLNASSTYLNIDSTATTKPFTWDSNDQIVYRYAIRAKRV